MFPIHLFRAMNERQAYLSSINKHEDIELPSPTCQFKKDGVSALRSPETEPGTDVMASLPSLFPSPSRTGWVHMKWQEKALLRPSEATSILVPSYKTPCLHMTSSLLGSGWARVIIRINSVGALRKAHASGTEKSDFSWSVASRRTHFNRCNGSLDTRLPTLESIAI